MRRQILIVLSVLLIGCSSNRKSVDRKPVEKEYVSICMYGPQDTFYIYTCPGESWGCNFISSYEDEADNHVEKCQLIKEERK